MDLIYKDSFVVDGERYYHYSYGGKWQATKFVTVHGINYYNSKEAFQFETIQKVEDRDRVILHLVKRLETELEECCEITCDRDQCLSIVEEIKRILSI